jgi:hypothetical protein
MVALRAHTYSVNLLFLALCLPLPTRSGASDRTRTSSVESSSEGRVLAESNFLWDDEGWTLNGLDGLTHVSKMIKATDHGPQLWYFVAPEKFLGNKRQAVRLATKTVLLDPDFTDTLSGPTLLGSADGRITESIS